MRKKYMRWIWWNILARRIRYKIISWLKKFKGWGGRWRWWRRGLVLKGRWVVGWCC